MKYTILFLILTGVAAIIPITLQHVDAFGVVTSDPMKYADVVVFGKITSAIPDKEAAQTKYTAKIDEILKGSNLLENGNQTKSLVFFSPGYAGYQGDGTNYPIYDKVFHEGDKTLLLLHKKDGVLRESLLSRVTTSDCTAREVMDLFYVPGGGLEMHQDKANPRPFYTDMPITAKVVHFNKELKSTSVNVTIEVVHDWPEVLKSKTVQLDLEECQPYAVAQMNFTVNTPGSFTISGGGETVGGVEVIDYVPPPLTQLDSGVDKDNVQCKENLELVHKYDSTPACVKTDTKQELIERGWAKG